MNKSVKNGLVHKAEAFLYIFKVFIIDKSINIQPFPNTQTEQQALRKCRPVSSWSGA